MILCNLPEILGKRRLKIAKVAADTGISRTTLTSLYYDTGKGVQFETINRLCIYLNIGIGELFTAVPFDIIIENSSYDYRNCNEDSVLFECEVLTVEGSEFVDLEAIVKYSDDLIINVDIVFLPVQPRNTEAQNQILTRIFKNIPKEALDILKSRFVSAFVDSSLFPTKRRMFLEDELCQPPRCVFPEAFITKQ